MTEKNLRGLFGGGEADESPRSQAASESGGAARDGRRGGGRRGGRRRRRSPEERAKAQDFIQRYTTGNPTEGFSSQEAVGYLQELRGEVPPEVMQRAAVETVRNLPEEQRKQFAEMLERRRAGTGMVTIERTGESRATEGREAAQPGGMDDMLGGLLGGLLGGGMAQPEPRERSTQASDPFGDLLGGLLGGGMGATEPDPRRQDPQEQGGGIGDILGSPLGKAVLGGIAAYAMKELMDQDDRA